MTPFDFYVNKPHIVSLRIDTIAHTAIFCFSNSIAGPWRDYVVPLYSRRYHQLSDLAADLVSNYFVWPERAAPARVQPLPIIAGWMMRLDPNPTEEVNHGS